MDSGPVDSGPLDSGPVDSGPVDSGPDDTFTIVTWNVENLFDEIDDPAKQDTVLTAEQVTAKMALIGAQLRPLAPDVVALQEVENAEILSRLVSTELSALGLTEQRLINSFDPRGIDVAIATRYPIESTVSHLGQQFYSPEGYGPFYYSRDCLEVHMNVNGRTLVVLVNHQISKATDTVENERKRQAQSKHTREIADQLRAEDPGRMVIIVGDMNDEPGSVSMSQYLSGGAWIDVALDVPSASRWTFRYFNSFLRLDYILADPDIAAWMTSVGIVHQSGFPRASDHEPVVATFRVP